MLTLERTTPRPAAPGPLAPQALHALQWVAARRPVAGFMGPTRDVAHAVSTTLAADSSIALGLAMPRPSMSGGRVFPRVADAAWAGRRKRRKLGRPTPRRKLP